MLCEYDVVWFEEPLRPDDLQGYVRLTENARLPIASCEVLTRRQAFMPWIEQRAVDYIQPDVTKVGGITEEFRIAQHACDHSILFVPHGWNTAVGLAADLQLDRRPVDGSCRFSGGRPWSRRPATPRASRRWSRDLCPRAGSVPLRT